jgi:hypothetical protein
MEALPACGEVAPLNALEEFQCVSVVPDDDRDVSYYQDASCTTPLNLTSGKFDWSTCA